MIQARNGPKNNDVKKTSCVNHIISLDRQYKPRNTLNNETFS